MLRIYLLKAEKFELTEEVDRIWELINSVLYFGAKPYDVQNELEDTFQLIDDYIEICKMPLTEEEIKQKYPNFREDEKC